MTRKFTLSFGKHGVSVIVKRLGSYKELCYSGDTLAEVWIGMTSEDRAFALAMAEVFVAMAKDVAHEEEMELINGQE